MSDYIPIPVAWARDIADQGQKDIVVVVAFDRAHDKSHVTTFGKTAEDKIVAAKYGDMLGRSFTAATGEPKENYADWRLLDQAKVIEALNAAVRVIRQWHARHPEYYSDTDDAAWLLYYENAPEMAPVREVLR